MIKRILVTYATWKGSTQEIALAISETLKEKKLEVDVKDVRKVKDVSLYDAVVIGTAVRMGRVHPRSLSFIKKFQKSLCNIPVAYFVVCLTMMEDTEENRCKTEGFLKVLKEKSPFEPVSVGLFGGTFDINNFSFPLKLFMKKGDIPQGDFRNWDVIRNWTSDLPQKFSNEK